MGVIVGTHERGGVRRDLVFGDADRHHHVYAIGQTGTGKTTFLRNAILQDIEAGRGVAVIDPHGDLALDLLDMIPPWRTNDVVYFDPSDTEYPIGLNPIAKTDPRRHHLVVLNTVSTLRGLWSDVWGLGRMQYILTNTLASLMYYEHATLLSVNRMLADERFRTKVLARVRDPILQAFWRDEFARYDSRLKAEAVAPIQNKVGQFGTTRMTRNILGQARNAVDFRRVIDRGQIFIANLAKGTMGEDNSRLIGSFLVAQFQLAALGRADIGEEERVPFFLYIDEFQNFTSVESLASILSEARKYRLSLTLAHQYTGQLGTDLCAAVFGNVGTIVCFRIGFEDARLLAEQLAPLAPHSLTELDPHRAWVRQIDQGTMCEPTFTALDPPYAPRQGRGVVVLKESRRKYATQRAVVERNIATWLAH
jgi:type IV secretory pathway TraG/TraD family ATPase VirD4